MIEKAKDHRLNTGLFTEQALTSILNYVQTQNGTESSKFLSAVFSERKCVGP